MVCEPAVYMETAGSLAEHIMMAKLPDTRIIVVIWQGVRSAQFHSLTLKRAALVLQTPLEHSRGGSQEHTSYLCALASQSVLAEIEEWVK